MHYQHWLMASVVFIILEILPPPTHFFFVCMAIGALGGSIAALSVPNVAWLPWVVFAVVTVALTPLLIPLAKFLFTPKPHASNVDSLLGQKVLVLEAVDPRQAGRVKAGGEEWRAVTYGDRLEKESWVLVEKVEGTSLVVRRLS